VGAGGSGAPNRLAARARRLSDRPKMIAPTPIKKIITTIEPTVESSSRTDSSSGSSSGSAAAICAATSARSASGGIETAPKGLIVRRWRPSRAKVPSVEVVAR